MNFEFWDFFGTLNPPARVGLMVLGVSLMILFFIGIYYMIRAVVKGLEKESKAAAQGLSKGLEKARVKIEASKPKIQASIKLAKQKVSAALAIMEQKLDEAFNGTPAKPAAPVAPAAPPAPAAPTPPAPPAPPAPADPFDSPAMNETETNAPAEEQVVAPDYAFEFSPEKLPQYCAHCGAQFTATMLQRVSHNLSAFCAQCGLKFTPTDGPSYQKLVDEVLQQ